MFNPLLKAAEDDCEKCTRTVHEEGVIPQTTRRLFLCFKNGNFNLKDGLHTQAFDEERLNVFFMKINVKRPRQVNCEQYTVVNPPSLDGQGFRTWGKRT